MKIPVRLGISVVVVMWVWSGLGAPASSGSSEPAQNLRHHLVHKIAQTVLEPGGKKVERQAEYTQLETAILYQENGVWKKAQEEIELREHHAVAYQGAHRVIFQANINRAGAIYLIDAQGREVRSHVLGISYFDAASGKSVLLSELKDSVGQLVPPNQLVYKDAFADLKGDIRFTYTKAGLEQDVILSEAPPEPQEYGLDPATTRLEVLTEFIAPPAAKSTEKKLKVQTDPKRRVVMKEPDWVDETLDFGSWMIGLGKAFYAKQEPAAVLDPDHGKGARAGWVNGSVPVAKRWLKMEGRQFLIESVEYAQLKSQPGAWESKPAPAPKREVGLQRILPQLHPSLLDEAQERVQIAALPYQPKGLVLDYYLVHTTADFTFESGKTYFINGEVYLSGTTTIENDAVIKLGSGALVRVLGPLVSPSKKAYVTAAHDQVLGVAVPARRSGRAEGAALSFHNLPDGTVVQNLELRYAPVGMEIYAPQATHTIDNCAFYKCETALEAFGASVLLHNTRLTQVKSAHRNLGGGAEITSRNVITTRAQQASRPVALSTYDDHGNSTGAASYLGANGGIYGSIDYAGDEDYFRVDISSTGTLSAYTTGGTDTYGYLLDAWGYTLTSNDDNPYPNFNFSYAVNPGTYYIRVRHYSSYGTGGYALYSSFAPSYNDDHGNSIGSATYMSANGSAGGTIDYQSDEDYFGFYVSSPGTVNAYTTGSTDTYGYLLDTWGNTLTSNDDNPYPNFNFSYSVSSSGYYYIRLRHYSVYGTGSYTLYVNFTGAAPPPSPPSGLGASVSSYVGQVNLSWAGSSGATSYYIKRSSSSSGPFSTVATTSATSFSDTGLSLATTYYYVVSAWNSSGESGNSSWVSAATAPYTPTGVSASAGSGYTYVSWNATSGAYYYRLKRSSSSGSTYFDTGSTSYFDPSASPGTTFTFRVSAFSASGGESYDSAAASATTAPAAPGGLSASGGNQQISLSWSGATGASSYTVKRSTSSSGSFNPVASGISSTSYTDTGLAAGTTYYYTVSASNSGGESSDSNQASATTLPSPPSTPTGLSASPGHLQISLSWSSVSGATSYSLKRWNGSSYVTIWSGGSTSYLDSGLAANSTYYYVVNAANGSGSSGDSGSVSATTAPATPSGLWAWGGNGTVSLSWNPSSGATSYRVQRSVASGGPFSTVAFAGSSSFTDSGLSGGTTYFYVVSAINSSGAESSSSSQASATTTPSAPTGLSAWPGIGQVSLSWNGVPGASGYYLKRLSGSGGSPVATYGLTGTSYTETGLGSATTYYYVVSAYNSSGEGSTSGQASATTAPAQPSGLGASASATQITLSWSAAAGASYYRVKRSTTSGGSYSTVASPSATSYSDSGLSTGVTYYYVISAVNGSGLEGPNSSQLSVTTVVADSDGDGLPDSWEQQYFGSLSQSGSGDYDGDGLTNLQEYQSGTNPAIANASVRIARPRNGSNFP